MDLVILESLMNIVIGIIFVLVLVLARECLELYNMIQNKRAKKKRKEVKKNDNV